MIDNTSMRFILLGLYMSFGVLGCSSFGEMRVSPNGLNHMYREEGFVHDDGSYGRFSINFSHCPVVASYTRYSQKIFKPEEAIEVWIRDCRR